jgi:hypothetical protein
LKRVFFVNEYQSSCIRIVWNGSDGNDSEIFLYNGSQIIQITDNEYLDNKADINDFGYIVWEGGSGTLSEVYLYDGLTTIQFTNHGQFSSDTHINNLGDVTWAE